MLKFIDRQTFSCVLKFQLVCKDNFKYEVSDQDISDSQEMLQEPEPPKPVCGKDYIKTDRFFLVAMPCLFFVFNAAYWLSFGSHLILTLDEASQ